MNEKSQMITQSTILAMGWTRTMIKNLLPEPTERPNPHYIKMINKEKIKYNEPIYYMPTYGGTMKISVIKAKTDNLMLVKQYSKKKDFKAFVTPIEHIYNKPEHAQRGSREWEHYMRHRKNNKKSK